jgi:hypothetical protein
LKQGRGQDRLVVHLGGMKKDSQVWPSCPRFFALDDLFEIQSARNQFRAGQISRAIRACEERATLRAFGMSFSTAHGWEDLSCFV